MNWTKVGLKVDDGVVSVADVLGLNWTKVGLKGMSGTGRTAAQGAFELD